jgi:thioredoxin reductase (NADPH)
VGEEIEAEVTHERLIIIGSGPAGLTAALYAARADLEPLVFEGLAAGGQLMITTDVENYPGFPDGIMGPDLMGHFRKQAERFGARLKQVDVTAVDLLATPKRVSVGGDDFTADAVIIATGATAKWLGVPGELELTGRGVSACATCDGFFFRDQELIVVGGGDTAMEEALFLTKFASKVVVVHRRDEFRASKIMAARVLDHPKIEVMWNTIVTGINGVDSVSSVTLEDTVTGEVEERQVDGVFIAIGHKPATDLFVDQIDLDENGYIEIQPGTTKTSLSGIFAAGDVADHVYRQAVTAAGTGCMAAMDAERWLADQE